MENTRPIPGSSNYIVFLKFGKICDDSMRDSVWESNIK